MITIDRWYSNSISSLDFHSLEKFVEDQKSSHPAYSNMTSDDAAGFLFNIQHQRRWTWDQGEIAVIKEDNQIIGVSAVERSSLHGKLSIGGIRMWIAKEYRNRPLLDDRNSFASKLLLISNLEWSKKEGMWAMMVTFNDYNKTLFDGIQRKACGKGIIGDQSDFWSDGQTIDKQLFVRHTMQWCVLKPIDKTGCKMIKRKLNHTRAFSKSNSIFMYKIDYESASTSC